MEAVLDQIIERKRMDDLAHSIVDGRFREQKIIDGLHIMTTKSLEDTVDLLAALSRRLQSRVSNDLYVNHQKSNDMPFKLNTLNALSWCEFVKLANKSPDPSIRDIFAKHLMQIPGCSGPKITSIMEKYPTPCM
ncbi:unnamed protein product [Schistosoma curassoni]|uniref:Crossover junction endonuclease MUS81 n=1 Tax=Schistosoma curassoni TaxID=6186 RepID=A0A183JYM8_9TREM|nr:unnamed protein product [Schistosoma curassoni]